MGAPIIFLASKSTITRIEGGLRVGPIKAKTWGPFSASRYSLGSLVNCTRGYGLSGERGNEGGGGNLVVPECRLVLYLVQLIYFLILMNKKSTSIKD